MKETHVALWMPCIRDVNYPLGSKKATVDINDRRDDTKKHFVEFELHHNRVLP